MKAIEFNAVEIKDCKAYLQTTNKEMLVSKNDNAYVVERSPGA